MARKSFANRRRMGKKLHRHEGQNYSVLCGCNRRLNPPPLMQRITVDDGVCPLCMEWPYIDRGQHDNSR